MCKSRRLTDLATFIAPPSLEMQEPLGTRLWLSTSHSLGSSGVSVLLVVVVVVLVARSEFYTSCLLMYLENSGGKTMSLRTRWKVVGKIW